MLSILLIVLYCGSLLFLLHRLTRRDRPYLSFAQLTASFLIKVLFGILYGYLFMRFYRGDDTWQYHLDSLVQYNKLLHHPLRFVRDTFTETGGSLSLDAAYSTSNSFWSDFEEVLFVRMLALFDVLSLGNYYVNVVLFCFVAYLGHLLLYRLMVGYHPQSAPFLRVGIFYYPVVLFWLSGIRKEGLLLLGMAVLLYYFNKLLQKKGSPIKNILLCLAALLMLWLIRNLVVLCMAPALLGWFLRKRACLQAWRAYALVYGLCLGGFFFADRLLPFPNLAQKLAERQHSFLSLEGNTRLPLDSLNAHPSSYLQVLPQALNHSFLQPTLWQSKSPLHLASALDVFLFFGFGAFCFYCRDKGWTNTIKSPLFMTLLPGALAGYLAVGYIVPFPGAFVRYKSLFEILFLGCFGMVATGKKLPGISNLYIWKNRTKEN
ncbi:MAG: hypothetical protein INR73_04060 [Williamsia sp.]|nr:hypothetical protein [Williamsia sp.]